MDKTKYTIGQRILGVVFVLWFLGAIVALMLTGKTDPWLALVVIGQFFLYLE